MAVVFHAAAAQRRARQAQPAEIHILSVSLGLRASLYLESTPATPEIHAAALLRSLRSKDYDCLRMRCLQKTW